MFKIKTFGPSQSKELLSFIINRLIQAKFFSKFTFYIQFLFKQENLGIESLDSNVKMDQVKLANLVILKSRSHIF